MTNLSIQDRINQELNKILQALQQLEIFLRELSNQSDVMYQNALINSIALNLHGVYTGIERIFEAIAKKIAQRFPYSCQLDEEKVLIIAHQIVNSYQTIINEIQLFCNNLSKGET
ncbi:MAG: hypothetical protein GPI94_24360 [Microcystis aeruginosa LG13-03]|nr:hypothetical protein [Microcystis aeruginosa LG13-03]